MAIKRPAPKTFSVEEANKITNAFANQTIERRVSKSYDPNYPVFEVPVDQKVLVYIPNHVVTAPDGSIDLRKDAFMAHPVIDGKTFMNVRCIQGMRSDDPQLNWDGSCPLCDGMGEVWDLYKKEYASIAAQKGIDPESPEAKELLKADRKELVRGQVISQPVKWFTFPIVVIECEEKDGVLTTDPKFNEQGHMVGHPMWYSIRESTFIEKWEAGYDSLDEIPASPAGLWAVLNFTYPAKNGKPDKMGSAKALKVTYKTYEKYADWARYYDQITADWTPLKAQETVVLDSVRSMEETQEVADSLLKPVRDKLALFNLNTTVGLPQNANADNALANFGNAPALGATPAPAPAPALEATSAPMPAPAPAPMPANTGAAPMPAPAPTTAGATPTMPMMGDINNVGLM